MRIPTKAMIRRKYRENRTEYLDNFEELLVHYKNGDGVQLRRAQRREKDLNWADLMYRKDLGIQVEAQLDDWDKARLKRMKENELWWDWL